MAGIGKAGSKEWERNIKRSVCPGCRHDRYNQGRGEAADGGAPISTDKCWMLEPNTVKYDRRSGSWSCKCRQALKTGR